MKGTNVNLAKEVFPGASLLRKLKSRFFKKFQSWARKEPKKSMPQSKNARKKTKTE